MPASSQFPDLPSDWSESVHKLTPLGSFYRLWSKKNLGSDVRVLFLVHGFGEHSDRYRHWPALLQNHVDVIAISDLYGHGQSPGAKGSCRTSEDWLGGVELALKQTETFLKRDGRRPQIAMLGHSFGGLLALELARQGRLHSVKHLFLSAPLLGLVNEPPIWKTLLGKWIEPFAPQIPLANDIDPSVVSKEAEVVQWYKADPLNHGLITPRAYQQLTELIEKNMQNHSALGLPVTLFAPGADPLVSAAKTANWFKKLEAPASSPKTRLDFAGLRHEAFNEVEKSQVFAALATELDQTLKN